MRGLMLDLSKPDRYRRTSLSQVRVVTVKQRFPPSDTCLQWQISQQAPARDRGNGNIRQPSSAIITFREIGKVFAPAFL